jgi:hypothetical protein
MTNQYGQNGLRVPKMAILISVFRPLLEAIDGVLPCYSLICMYRSSFATVEGGTSWLDEAMTQ